MKNHFIKSVSMLLAAAFSFSAHTQTVADFENLTLPPDSFWNGSSQPLGATFTSGNAEFPCFYDTSWGGFWSSGWAYSNMQDDTTAGFMNQYSVITAGGYDGSTNYAVGQNSVIVRLTGNAAGKTVAGFYVTNSTFAFLSMRDGDAFAKQFGSPNDANGDPDGTNGEDWFKLTIKKWHNGTMDADSVDFYLADFRFSDNSQDYIVDSWEWVDVSSLGNVDSLLFTLTSSDLGPFGMNTPAYFCMDNFTTKDMGVSVAEYIFSEENISVYPNPATDFIMVNFGTVKNHHTNFRIFDAAGRMMHEEMSTETLHTIPLAQLKAGFYTILITGDEISAAKNFIKQ